MSGRLELVATPIGNLGDVGERAKRALAEADVVLAEDTRRARALLRALGVAKERVERLDAHVEGRKLDALLDRLEAGERLALVSDAGTPGVSDPGATLVSAAVERGIAVAPIPGPSAVATALAASGFPADRFRFFGFLPRSGAPRREAMAQIGDTEETVVLFEAPGRAAATLAALAERMPQRRAVVARELTKVHEQWLRGTLAELAERAETGLRGELTVVLGPMTAPRPELDVDARIDDLLSAGLRGKDVAKAIALETDMSASEAYKRVLMRKDRQP